MNKEFQSNFTRGEVSEFIGARPDLQAYFNGLSILENYQVYPEGAVQRVPGTKFIRSTKSDGVARLIPFVVDVNNRYMIELGGFYARVLDEEGNLIQELSTPWSVDEINLVHYRQSVDILFTAQANHEPRQINRLSPTEFSITPFGANPPPTFEADTDISGGTATLTPGAVSGAGINFSASALVFLDGDVRRQIVFGASRGIIASVLGGSQVTVNIISPFPNTNPIPAGQWFLRGSPQTTLDPDLKEPVGAPVNLVAGANAFRVTDIGKYVRIYDGLAKIYAFTDAQHVAAEVITTLSGSSDANPTAAAAGSWTLEESSWSDLHGWPRTLEFHQGRLHYAGTADQPTTDWASAVDDYYNFAKKPEADAAIEIPIAARRLNPIHWLLSLAGLLFIGDAESEHTAKGQGSDAPMGGDVLPFVNDASESGSQPVQPMVINDAVIFANRYGNKMWELAYGIDENGFTPRDLTLLTRHLGEMKFFALPGAYAQEPSSIIYKCLQNGQLACLTRHRKEDVAAWSRIITDGQFQDVAVLPGDDGHRVWVIVQRLVNGQIKRFIEIFEDRDPNWTNNGRAWTQVMTHAAVTGLLVAGASTIAGLAHLEAKVVDVIVGVDFLGQFTVSAGSINIGTSYPTDQIYEVGIHYKSTLRTLRPAVPNNSYLGHRRKWLQVALLLKDTIGGLLNGKPLRPGHGDARPYNGVTFANPTDNGYDGYLTATQDEPYPMSIMGVAGVVEFTEKIG